MEETDSNFVFESNKISYAKITRGEKVTPQEGELKRLSNSYWH